MRWARATVGASACAAFVLISHGDIAVDDQHVYTSAAAQSTTAAAKVQLASSNPPPVFLEAVDSFVVPRHPVCLHHGLGGWGGSTNDHLPFQYFSDVKDHLESVGVVVLETEVTPMATIEQRAQELRQQIDAFLEESGHEKVNIIAHSMGGLDSRALLVQEGACQIVSSVVTLCSPHLGSALVDAPLSKITSKLSAALPAFNLMGVSQLAPEAMAEWHQANNAQLSCRECNHVIKLSISATDPLPFHHPLKLGQELIDGPNDGMVSVQSAGSWGKHLGTVPTNHAGIIGWNIGMLKEPFDHLGFYSSLVTLLALLGN